MESKVFINKNLFWDVNFNELYYEKDADFIIERVLNYGDEKDFFKAVKIYGLAKIKNVARKTNYTSRKNINFWSIIFDIPLNSFKCEKKFLAKKQSIFLRR